MIKIAIYGKGGIGKSTVASNLSAALSFLGRRPIQIGCDPKADSTSDLLSGEEMVPVLEYLRTHDEPPSSADQISKIGYGGVLCIECGGPSPGMGCAGRGIISTFSVIEEMGIFEQYRPDAVIYDVLGDVVCGGFAAPIREGYAKDVLIVTSGEKMSLYAARNICRAVENFRSRGYAKLKGIVLDRRDVPDEERKVRELAREANVPILADIPRSDDINRCEDMGKTVIEHDAELDISKRFIALAQRLIDDEENG